MDYRDLGIRVRTIRRQAGMTQEELAEKVGISASFLGHIERGSRVASLETLVALCNTLNISPVYLLEASLLSTQETALFPEGTTPEMQHAAKQLLHLAEGLAGRLQK